MSSTPPTPPGGIPDGYRDIPEEERKKARKFFDHARTVAASGQFEYAIEMFIQGLSLDPEDVDQHKLLRDIALKRKVSGGKSMGMFEKNKYPTTTKDDKQNMLNAERRLAYEPGNTDYMITLAQGAQRSGFYDTALWIADIALRANRESPKPDYNKYIVLKDVYKAIGRFKEASDACTAALEVKPHEMDLQGEMKNLAALHAMHSGNYQRATSFRGSMKNQAAQDDLLAGERDVHNVDFLTKKVIETEATWRAAPDDQAKFGKFIDALRATERLEEENRAIELLEEQYHKNKNFRFRQRAGEIRMAQLSRMERTLREQLKHATDPEEKKELTREYNAFMLEKTKDELEEYRLRSEAYPTDSEARFKMAERMFLLRQFQDVIPMFQQVRADPKYRAPAGTLLGRAFFEAGFHDEAIDTLKSVIDEYPGKGDEKSKDMTYWFGRALEAQGDAQAALRQYSLVAQMDFKYRDVQDRVKALRSTTPKQ